MPRTPSDLTLKVIIPAYIISELRTGFQIGAVLYLPFLVIDFTVASITLSIGMMQLPPVMISAPFKILLFVLVDGWNLSRLGRWSRALDSYVPRTCHRDHPSGAVDYSLDRSSASIVLFVAGIVISLVQIITSIQDPSFGAVPRLAIFFVTLLVILPWIVIRLVDYTGRLFGDLGKYAR